MNSDAQGTTVAVLGTGLMGEPMARRLLDGGAAVRVWNRTPEKAAPLAAHGATVAGTAREAAEGADVVVTMLLDATAVEAAMDGPDGGLAGMREGTTWLQMSTVGLDGCARLADLAAGHGVAFVDAPVLGTRKPAEDGTLKVLASGPADVVERCRPVLERFGTVVDGLGAAGAGSRLKLVVNAWLLTLTDATAASLALARRLGLDGRLFLRTIEGTPTDAPYAQLKGSAMLDGLYPASFAVSAAAKDAGLVLDAAHEVGADASLVEAVRHHLDAALMAGYGDDDLAAIFGAYCTS